MVSTTADNEKHPGSQNQDEQNLERHGYVQQTKVRDTGWIPRSERADWMVIAKLLPHCHGGDMRQPDGNMGSII